MLLSALRIPKIVSLRSFAFTQTLTWTRTFHIYCSACSDNQWHYYCYYPSEGNIRHALNFYDSIIHGFGSGFSQSHTPAIHSLVLHFRHFSQSLLFSFRSVSLSFLHSVSFFRSVSVSLSFDSNRFSFHLISFYLSKNEQCSVHSFCVSPSDFDAQRVCVCIVQIYESIIAKKVTKHSFKREQKPTEARLSLIYHFIHISMHFLPSRTVFILLLWRFSKRNLFGYFFPFCFAEFALHFCEILK